MVKSSKRFIKQEHDKKNLKDNQPKPTYRCRVCGELNFKQDMHTYKTASGIKVGKTCKKCRQTQVEKYYTENADRTRELARNRMRRYRARLKADLESTCVTYRYEPENSQYNITEEEWSTEDIMLT